MTNWNPDQYLKFVAERTQASIDLASKTTAANPASIIDIGCGPGNSTRVIMERWPAARVTGIDSSPEMIARARKELPGFKWLVGDAQSFKFTEGYDVVFSNAALQWMPDHESLIPRLFGVVKAGGALAVQVPADQDSPLRKSLLEVASDRRWSACTSGCEKLINYRTGDYYYDILAGLNGRFDVWETIYYHVLPSHEDLVEWYKGTAMRPFLEKLPDDETRREFELALLARCRERYEVRKDGKVLYPFKRIFFVAYK